MPAGHQGYGSAARPALAVCDPALMASAPRETLTATAMNALAHGIEALYGPLANPVTEGASLRGAPLIVDALESDQPDAGDLSLGALLGGWSVGVAAGLVVHHACCQTLVGVLRTPHAPDQRGDAAALDRLHGRSRPRPAGPAGDALGEPDVAAVSARVAAGRPPGRAPRRWPTWG